MKLREYFEAAKGRGVFATSNSDGFVDEALYYATPYFIDEKTIAFIMTDRPIHDNLKSNPHAAYLFVENVERYAGKRLYLTKIREETDPDLIEEVRRSRNYDIPEPEQSRTKFLVYFSIDKVLPLVGDK